MSRFAQGLLPLLILMVWGHWVEVRASVEDIAVPQRIVSLAPNITEILFSLGLDREIVGVTQFCDYPPKARTKAKVGGISNPGIESIVRMRPDLVFAVKGFTPPELVSTLRRLHVPVREIPFGTLEEVYDGIVEMGAAVGHPLAARRLAEGMRDRVREIQVRGSRAGRAPRVLYVLSEEPLMSVGPGSFIHELIQKAGGANVMGDSPNPYPLISMESIMLRNPEVILFSSEIGRGREDVLARWRRWRSLDAVTSERLFWVDADLLNRPGPRVVEGLDYLQRILYGPNIDP
jgi:iron complex transport system substrate-binding protein